MKLRRDQSLLLGAAALAVMLWAIDPLRPLLLPLIYLNTHLHELCHGIMGVLTGARVDHIVVRADGSGYALMAGGSIIPMASAGYVGTAVLGGILMAVARKGENARLALATLAGSLGFGMLLWVRGDVIGVISGLFWVGLLWLLSRKLTADQATWSVQFLGVQLALTTVQAFLALIHLSTSDYAATDARILQEATGIPALAWSGAWLVISAAAVTTGLRHAWKPASRPSS